MSDERAEVRAVLDAVSADPPPTRLSVDQICAAARRGQSSRPRPPLRAWLRRLSALMPSVRLVAQVAAVAVVVAVLPGLVVLALVTSQHGDTGGGAGSAAGGGGAPSKYQASPGADSGRAASGGATAGTAPQVRGLVGLARTVELSADQRTLSAAVTAGGCHGPLALKAQERPDRVLVTATEDVRGLDGKHACSAHAEVTTLTTRLGEPLGTRHVVDARTGRTLLVLDRSKVAEVTHLPAGYRADGTCRPPSTTVDDAAAPPAVAACTAVYSNELIGGDRLGLTVTQYLGHRPPDRNGPTWDPPASAQVHGLPAQLRLGHEAGKRPGQTSYTRQLLWTENGVTVSVSSGPAGSPDRLLSAAELLRVADGIRW
jgi:hypothetical protein